MGNRRSYASIRLHMWASGRRTCYYCNVWMTNKSGQPNSLTVDHKTPLGRQGRDERSNYAACCYRCNNAKGNLTEPEFRELLASGKAFDISDTERKKRIAFASEMETARRMRELRLAQVHP